MRKFTAAVALAAGLLALTACGGKGDDTMADNVEAAAENRADALEDQADNLEAQADNVRDEGDRKEEAIDDSDINARDMNGADQARVANSM